MLNAFVILLRVVSYGATSVLQFLIIALLLLIKPQYHQDSLIRRWAMMVINTYLHILAKCLAMIRISIILSICFGLKIESKLVVHCMSSLGVHLPPLNICMFSKWYPTKCVSSVLPFILSGMLVPRWRSGFWRYFCVVKILSQNCVCVAVFWVDNSNI